MSDKVEILTIEVTVSTDKVGSESTLEFQVRADEWNSLEIYKKNECVLQYLIDNLILEYDYKIIKSIVIEK